MYKLIFEKRITEKKYWVNGIDKRPGFGRKFGGGILMISFSAGNRAAMISFTRRFASLEIFKLI